MNIVKVFLAARVIDRLHKFKSEIEDHLTAAER